jgi:hypothetical protein
MSKELLKSLIDYIPQQDIDTLYKVIVKFIPEDAPMPDEIEAIEYSMTNKDTPISHSAINWN